MQKSLLRGGCLCVRHRVYGRHLGRDKNQRQALFKSLVRSLFTYGTIETSETKVKAIKGLVDKLINLAKNKNTQHMIQSFFTTKALRERIIKEVAPKLSDRQSGYTSTIRVGSRAGDNAMVVRMSLINNEKLKPFEKKSSALSTQSSDKKQAKAKEATSKESKPAKKPVQVTKKEGRKTKKS